MSTASAATAEGPSAAVRRKRRRLRLALLCLSLLLGSMILVLAYLSTFTDVLVLRRAPIEQLRSPEGRWELRVYEVEAGSAYEEHGGVWLATVVPADDPDAEQRPVYHGDEVTFTWLDDVTLLAREYPTDVPGAEHQIDVVRGSYGVEDRWAGDGHGLAFVAAFLTFLPAVAVLVGGAILALVLPALIWREPPSILGPTTAGHHGEACV